MSYTDVDICNMALARVGAKGQISELTEGSNEAIQCNLVYNHLRLLLLSRFNWSFATKYLTLADLGNPPAGWSYQYSRPSDLLRIREIYAGGVQQNIAYELATVDSIQSILTNEAEAQLKYVSNVTSPSDYDSPFIEALSTFIASRIVMPLSRDPRLLASLREDFMLAIRDAQASSANQEQQEVNLEPIWMTGR